MAYALKTPYRNETWIADGTYASPYARLAGRRLTGGTINGSIPISITDIHRGISLIINGTTVTENQTPLYGLHCLSYRLDLLVDLTFLVPFWGSNCSLNIPNDCFNN